jgi:hypothetical protein
VKTANKKNLTLNLPVELIRDAKILAAQRGASLNALVQESLESAIRAGDAYTAAGERLLAASEKGLYDVPKKKWKRSELYDV